MLSAIFDFFSPSSSGVDSVPVSDPGDWTNAFNTECPFSVPASSHEHDFSTEHYTSSTDEY